MELFSYTYLKMLYATSVSLQVLEVYDELIG